jgi:hypothetical protein
MRFNTISSLVLGLITLGGCITIPPYDAITDQSLTAVLNSVAKHYSALEAMDQKGDGCLHSKDAKFYTDTYQQVRLIKLRATYLPNGATQGKYLDHIQAAVQHAEESATLAEKQASALQALHPGDTSRNWGCLPASEFAISEQTIERTIGDAIAYQAAIKPGGKS